MKLALKIVSWIGVIMGALALIGTATSDSTDSGAAFLGGALFLTQGVLALVYISQKERITLDEKATR